MGKKCYINLIYLSYRTVLKKFWKLKNFKANLKKLALKDQQNLIAAVSLIVRQISAQLSHWLNSWTTLKGLEGLINSVQW